MDETTLQLINMICRRELRVNPSAPMETIVCQDFPQARAWVLDSRVVGEG